MVLPRTFILSRNWCSLQYKSWENSWIRGLEILSQNFDFTDLSWIPPFIASQSQIATKLFSIAVKVLRTFLERNSPLSFLEHKPFTFPWVLWFASSFTSFQSLYPASNSRAFSFTAFQFIYPASNSRRNCMKNVSFYELVLVGFL